MYKQRFVFWGVFVVLAVLVSGLAGAQPVLLKDIVYGKAGDVELKLDLAKPAASDGPVPALVFIHGGGWQEGDKSGFEQPIRQFAAAGYVAASVGYRLAPKYPWPAQIEDVKCAVRYLRANAAEYGIDPDKIGAIGHSAGGHLSLLLGLMNPEDGFEGEGGNAGVSSKVQAVVNLCGPTDLRAWRALPEAQAAAKAASGKDFEDILKDFVGTTDREAPVIAEVSPVTYIDTDDPPILTFHGSKDPVVPVEQATILHDALEKAGVKDHKLVILEGADHGFAEPVYLLRILQEGREFADKRLKGIETADTPATAP